MDERPLWQQLFDAWEKEAGPRLEEYVQTDQFAEQMTAFQQRNRRMAEMNEEASRRFLRSWNLPTASDVEKLSQQVADIDRQLRALSQRVDQAVPAPGPRKRQGSKTPAGVKAALESRQAAAKQTEEAGGGGDTVEPETPATASTPSPKARSRSKPGSQKKAGDSQKASTDSAVSPKDEA